VLRLALIVAVSVGAALTPGPQAAMKGTTIRMMNDFIFMVTPIPK
jgi:hypothetical protein